MPTSETTPVWAHTVPVEPPDDAAQALPPVAMQNKGRPDWSKTQTPSSNGEDKKSAPDWAATIPTSEDTIPETSSTVDAEPAASKHAEPAAAEHAEPAAAEQPEPAAAEHAEPAAAEPVVAKATEPPHDESPATQPVKPAAGEEKKTWPPAAEMAPAPPEETDIWPPEPPTEPAMRAWPPPSELEVPATPAQAIPSWPDSFDAATTPPTITPAPVKPSEPPAKAAPFPAPSAAEPVMPPAAAAPPAPVAPPRPAPKAAPAPAPPPPPAPAAQTPPAPAVAPASPTPARPMWAPGPTAPATPATPKQVEGESPLQVPAWAPHVPLAGETGKPTWFSPKEAIPHATAQPIVTPSHQPEPAPAPPIEGGHLPVAPIPAPAAPAAAPGQPATNKSSWEVVEQHGKTDKNARVSVGITAEDRSYAEWFAWAKRGGAPASACHAAAQGAFKALASGKDVMTAVQWATAAMSQPPENVLYARQTYCAWFSLANIDLNLDQHRAHLFAGGAVQALDNGADPSGAHAAGLAAAGIR